MKKYIFTILIFSLMLMLLLTLSCLAESGELSSDVIEFEVASDAETAGFNDGSEHHTIFTRLREFFTEYKTEIAGAVGDIVIFVAALFSVRKGKGNELLLQSVKSDSSTSLSSQKSVVNVVNDLIDSYNDLKATYDRQKSMEDERNRLAGAALIASTTVLEMMTVIYPQSKNLPQGVKDRINLIYANSQKLLTDDKMLLELTERIKSELSNQTRESADEEENQG